MTFRVLEFSTSGAFLSKRRGHLRIEQGGVLQKSVPLDDIHAVLSVHPAVVATQGLLLALAERGIPYVLCGKNYLPAAFVWSTSPNQRQARRFQLQLGTKLPKKKRAWKEVVKEKIRWQAAVATSFGHQAARIEALASMVRSGDPANVEARAARCYWPMVFGKSFRRDPMLGGPNALLNYGYAVLRACTARAIMGAGLHPTLGIHHHGLTNPMALADDFMEPFRPAVDVLVLRLMQRQQLELLPEVKRELASIVTFDFETTNGRAPLSVCVQNLVWSWVAMLEKRKTKLVFPKISMFNISEEEPLPCEQQRA